MKNYVAIQLCMIILSFGVYQTIPAQTDSLFKTTKGATAIEKVDVLNDLSLTYLDKSLDSSLTYALMAYALADKNRYNIGKATALKQIGNYHMFQNKYSEALQYYDSALFFIKNKDKALPLVTILMNNKGVIYDMMGDFSNALSYYKEALKIRRTIDDYKGIAQNLHNIGGVYYQKGDYDIAIDYLLQSLKIEEKTGNTEGIGQTYVNIGSIYSDIGEWEQSIIYLQLALSIFQKTGSNNIIPVLLNLGIYNLLNGNNIEQSEKYLTMALDKSVEAKEEAFLPEIYYNLGKVNLLKGDYAKAKKFTDNAIHLTLVSGNKNILAQAYALMGDIHTEKKEVARAKQYYEQSLAISKELGLKNKMANTYKALADLHSLKQDYKNAYGFLTAYATLKDSVFSEEKHKQIAEMQVKYDVEQKENELALLSKENELQKLQFKQSRIIFIALLLLLTLSSSLLILVFQKKRLKANNNALELQQRLLRLQMNPHFIFNSVAAIQHYMLKNNPLEASSYLSRFANLMRNILYQSSMEFIALSKEIEMLEDYLKLQKLRLNNKFQYAITVDDTIDTEITAIPPLLLQPFIENAIEHGLLEKGIADGKIDLEIVSHENTLIFKIEDNGIGRKAAAHNRQEQHHSVATEIIRTRLILLRQSYPKAPDFRITDLYDSVGKEAGTRIMVTLPLIYVTPS